MGERDRLAVACLRATVWRLVFQHTPPEEAVAKLRAITTRPDLLGIVAGWCLADQDWPREGVACAELLFAAGGHREIAEAERRATLGSVYEGKAVV